LGWQNMARDGGIAVANIFIMMIPILLATSLFFIKDISAFLVSTLREKADISVYFNDSASEDDILKLQSTISQVSGIQKVDYVSKDNALEAFSARHQGDPTLMEALQQVNGNPFLASLTVRAADSNQYATVENLLSGDTYKDMINKVNYSEKKDIIIKIFSLTDQATRIGMILFAILGVISTLVTFNTVRLAIINRKEEIEVQRLVGASRWFVRGQFLVEGLTFGVLAAAFCLIIAASVCWYVSPSLAVLIPGINLWASFMASIWLLVGIQLGIGVFLGIASGIFATNKYLKI
jgi:cell division transport system permease protein